MERAAVHVVSSRALSTLPFYLPPKTVHQYPLLFLFLFLATETMPLDARRRTAAVANYRKKTQKSSTSSGPRYVVGCRSKVDKEKLISATRVVLDMTTLTIMRALPRERNQEEKQHQLINMGDAEEVSQHYRLMSRHTRDCLGVSFRCYAYIPVSGQEYVQLSYCLIETLNKDEVY
ncbi:unnamed protein product [Brassica oleracea]